MTATVHVDGPIGLNAIFADYRRAGFGDPTTRRREGTWWWTSRTPDGIAAARFVPGERGVTVDAWGPGADWVAARAPALLGVLDDPTGFLPHHPEVAAALTRAPELRFGRTARIVDELVPTILGQRVTGKAASDAWRAIVYRFGDRLSAVIADLPGDGDGLWAPPDPARLANEPYYALHPLGVERNRAQVLLEVCRRHKRIDALAAEPLAVATERLRTLRGIGPWTAAITLGRSHGDPDAVPVGDYHLPNAVAWVLAGEARADDARMLELLAPYAGHRARALRLIGAVGKRPPKFGPRADVVDFREW